MENYLTIEQQVSESQPVSDVASVVSELQLCVSKLQPVIDLCCALLLHNDTPDVMLLLNGNGAYMYFILGQYILGCL